MMVIQDVIRLMEGIAPEGLAEEWDNTGLQLGDRNRSVKHIMVSLDPTPEAVKAACARDADLLITHHPLIFRALKKIDLNTPIGEIIRLAIGHQLALFSAHTNLDSVSGGLNDIFAEKLGLRGVEVLCPLPASGIRSGLGRIGRVGKPTDLKGLSLDVKRRLGLTRLSISGAFDLPVEKVAVCTGSGSGLIEHFLRSDAQVFISGDLKYHDAREAEMHNRGLIDIGHFASELFMVGAIKDRLEKILKEQGYDIRVEAWTHDSDPFKYL